MTLAFLGTSEFAASVLRQLASSGRRPALALTRPDRPKGRGRKLASPPVAEVARELGIALEQPDDVRTLVLGDYEHVVVCAYGALLTEPLLSHPGLRNIHPSLLPRWRGAAPLERAIMAGDSETGVSIMATVAELDAGPVYCQEREPIGPDDDYGTLAQRLQTLSTRLLLRALDEDPSPRPQNPALATYAAKITAEDRALDPDVTAARNALVVRALSPHIGARIGDLGVWRAAAAGEVVVPPGKVEIRDGRVLWGCAGGVLELLELQPAGGRRMHAADYARGHR